MTVVHRHAEPLTLGDAQPRKQSLSFSDRLQASLWHLDPGQRISSHMHPRADDLLVVVHGEGEYLHYPEGTVPPDETLYEPSPTAVVVPPPVRPTDEGAERIRVTAGSIVIASAGTFHGVVNTSPDQQLVLAVATGPDTTASTYMVR